MITAHDQAVEYRDLPLGFGAVVVLRRDADEWLPTPYEGPDTDAAEQSAHAAGQRRRRAAARARVTKRQNRGDV